MNVYQNNNIFFYRFPNDTELHLIMKNQFSPMSLRFKPVINSRRIDQIVESLIEIYNEVSFFKLKIDSCSVKINSNSKSSISNNHR